MLGWLFLTDEQKEFVNSALEGHNILVDACIGSGKTSSINYLCSQYPETVKILYLTYNKLLKKEAQTQIGEKNVYVQNYHGFAYAALKRKGISTGVSDSIQRFLIEKPPIDHCDVLIVDEYQDIDTEISELLKHIKGTNPNIQLIFVGDMAQKIYNKTSLDIERFVHEFLGDYEKLEFTSCFRLSAEHAGMLGRVWKKQIVGVNPKCVIENMSVEDVVQFLSKQKPQDILCLGSRSGEMTRVLNYLETEHGNVFNKKTVYASIDDSDETILPSSSCAVFTTFDSSKGLERKICVVFDFTEEYWYTRLRKPLQRYDILRNIFCVAASRGKEYIIFVDNGRRQLSERALSTELSSACSGSRKGISELFDFRYKENIEECYRLLEITPIELEETEIKVKKQDDLIDLSPCVGIYQEAMFFDNYEIDKEIYLWKKLHPNRKVDVECLSTMSLEEKILLLTSLQTSQERYRVQVSLPFIGDVAREALVKRLSSLFTPKENVQVDCSLEFGSPNGDCVFLSAVGRADVVKDNVVYELKFVSELTHEHFLQCACYILALNLEEGVLWNTQNNACFRIRIRQKTKFLDTVARAVTNSELKGFYPLRKIAVIDTETTRDAELMTVGCVVADSKTLLPVDYRYMAFSPQVKKGGMYSYAISRVFDPQVYTSREEGIRELLSWLEENQITSIFAYNAQFDYKLLPELSHLDWFDIMQVAAYKQYNPRLPETAEYYNSGRLKGKYGVEGMMRLLTGKEYRELHNACCDAFDELKIMRLINRDRGQYFPLKRGN